MFQNFQQAGPAIDRHPAVLDPWSAALRFGAGTVMAVLVAVEGPAYRNRGAAMAIAADGRRAGALSSGCIEADVVAQASAVRATGAPRRLRYGKGSPFLDLTLPCGGAIEVLVFRLDDLSVLVRLKRLRDARQMVALRLCDAGRLCLGAPGGIQLIFRPPPRFVIFGAGAEATVFATVVHALGYDHVLLSHDERSLDSARHMGCTAGPLHASTDIAPFLPDNRCAALLFYHDHDHEPALLRRLLAGPAFYIGAQGSRATQARRLQALAMMGVPAAEFSRLRGPIGVIPSTRDPHRLAISVLAEVLQALPAPDSVSCAM